MIGKGKLFDIISRMADDVNNTDITISNMLDNYTTRKEKFDNQNLNKNDWER